MEFFDQGTDPDKKFSYNTRQVVRITDRKLGLTNYCLQLSIGIYIIVFVFFIDKAYNVYEEAVGGIATHVRGDAYGVSSGLPGNRYFSAEDLTHPGLENGNVFVSTRQKIYRQKRGVCEDHAMPCEIDEDCTVAFGGTCSEKGFCMEQSWCNVDDKPEVYDVDVSNLKIWAKSSILFVQLAPENIYSTENNHPYPQDGYNMFSIRELLAMCMPVPVRYEEISELGAAITIQYSWNCDVGLAYCLPTVRARRIDVLFDKKNIGYSFSYPEYISEDERLLYMVQGVRIFFTTIGRGRKVSVVAAILAIGTTTALLSLAQIVADLIMLNLMSQRKKYRARKYSQSPDFSDAMQTINAKAKEEENLPGMLAENDKQLHEHEQEWQRRLHEDD